MWLIPAVAAVGFFLLYVLTLAPDVVGHDAGEFQFVPYIFGIPHDTGYPLYLVAGKLWTLLPLGSVAWRMNLLSAISGAIAAVLTYLAARELTGSKAGGALAAMAVGLAPLEWTWSTIAGVRALAVAFVAGVLLLALRWERAVHAGSVKRANGQLVLLAFVCGLALDHHRTIALLLPFLAIYVVLICPDVVRNAGLLAKSAAAGLVPLMLYGVIPLRAAHGAPWDQFKAASWDGFVNLVTGRHISAAHLDLTASQATARWPLLVSALPNAFAPLLLLFAAAGLLALLLRRQPASILLLGYILVLGCLTLEWDTGPDLNLVYFMPAYVPIGLLSSAGLALIARLLSSRSAAFAVNALVLLTVAAAGLYSNRARFGPQREVLDDFRVNLFEGHQARRLADAFARLPPNASVVADWDQASALWYSQFIDGYNESATISYPAATLTDALTHARGPVFLATTTNRPSVPAVTAAGPFVQILNRPSTDLPATMIPAGGTFDGEIQLAGLAPLAQPEYGVLPVTLYWKTLRQPAGDYAISVRLMPDDQHIAAQRDEAAPVLGLSATSGWTEGQVTADYYELDVRGLADQSYALAVVLYQPLPGGGFRNLLYEGAPQAILGQISVATGRVAFRPAA